MARTGGKRNSRRRARWRDLGYFWLGILALLGAGAATLQYLGPLGDGTPARLARAPAPGDNRPGDNRPGDDRPGDDRGAGPVVIASQRLAPPVVTGRDTPGPVADPDPALLEPLSEGAKQNLPRIARDGRTPMQVYAAGFDHSSRRPRIGLLLAGIGLNEAESDTAIRALPSTVSLAVSPYAANVTRLLATARAMGHEYLIEVPLEPAGFPLNDPGPKTLLTSLSPAANAQFLQWAMSRIEGYVGAVGVAGTMRGERLAAMHDQMDAVLAQFAARGLLYVDPREQQTPSGLPASGQVPIAWGRHVESVIDEPADQDAVDRGQIDARLADLEQRARDHGSALGLVMRPTQVAVARILAWSNGLEDRGLTLAPVSALVQPPANTPVKLSERE